jgi:hypothetical protein
MKFNSENTKLLDFEASNTKGVNLESKNTTTIAEETNFSRVLSFVSEWVTEEV